MSNNAHDLSKRLLNALDNSYNVVDMHAVNEIISILERYNITKELLETTRLGKHVNELRRKTADPTLARRAKVLVKRWRDLVIPGATSSPAHTGAPVANRSSAERARRLGGSTPLTSPALARQVVSPAVNSPRLTSRPAWGGYESDSQDVIVVVDDDPPPPLLVPPPAPPKANSTSKRPLSPTALVPDEKKAKRDKKPKKKRGHSRAGSGSSAPAEGWAARNGSSPPAPPVTSAAPPAPAPHARKNGCRKPPDAYSAMVNRMPAVGAKKVKTTKELLEEIQSRGNKPAPSPASPGSPDVMLIEPDPAPLVKLESPLRNGASPAPAPPPALPPAPSPPPLAPLPPLEDPRELLDCTCAEDEEDPNCKAAVIQCEVTPLHVLALHHAYLPGVNGTRAPPRPHRYAVRPAEDPLRPGLFASVVPLYKYSDYADDYCVKNMSRVPLCPHLPWTEFAPDPPAPPSPPPPPEPRPYPEPDPAPDPRDDGSGEEDSRSILIGLDADVEGSTEFPTIKPEMVSVPALEPSDRLRPRLFDEEETSVSEIKKQLSVPEEFKTEQQEHRTVERTKEETPAFDMDGRTLYALCEDTRNAIPYEYEQVSSTPVVTLPFDIVEATDVLESSLIGVVESTERDDFGRPVRPSNFTEWHECAQLGDLIALPYVVID